ncbi:MAG: septal ring lytic transglycosylase RlpA family protein, partial [Actinomycetota bacterium]
PFTPAPTARADERGLPAAVVAARSLPGVFAFDPVTRRASFGAATDASAGSAPAGTPGAPAETPAVFDARASWYAPAGRMANGRPFDPRALTAAHRTLPLGSWLRITYRDRVAVVRVTDRGPYSADRDLSLSPGAAGVLGLTGPDTVHVEVVTGPAG